MINYKFKYYFGFILFIKMMIIIFFRVVMDDLKYLGLIGYWFIVNDF